MKNNADTTVLFADVSDSTALYEQLGDAAAQALVGQWLQCASEIIEGHRGRVVHRLGDEVLAWFTQADRAADSAQAIQKELQRNAVDFGMRIGIHSGPTPRDDEGKPYGSVVNVASRMVNLAKRGQIILSGDTFSRFSEATRSRSRNIGSIQIKGKKEACEVHELLWSDLGASTIQLPMPGATEATRGLIVVLKGREIRLPSRPMAYSLGRGHSCDVRVNTRVASRRHATLGFRLGSVVLADQSTNGTYVRTDLAQDIYLHRDECILPAQGLISLGVPVSDQHEFLIEFRLYPIAGV